MHLLLLISGCLLGWTGVWGQHEHHGTKEEEKKVMLGGEVVLPCKVIKPNESPTLHWFYVIPEGKNMQKILTTGPKGTVIEDPVLESRVSIRDNYKLVIGNVQVQDNKHYICRVEFQNGVTKEGKVHLNVYKTPTEPELKMEHNGISVTDDAVEIATCESKNGFPKPVIKWYKNDRPLRSGQNGVDILLQVLTESSGLISVTSTLNSPVQKSDVNASFYCDVSYSLPTGDHMLESDRKNITVHYPTTSLRVYFKSPSEIIKEGDTVELVCEGDGNPQPSYTLQKKDEETSLSDDAPYSWTVSREDSGGYVCKSFEVETLTELEAETELHVHYMDSPMLSHESPVTVDLQSNFMVSCQVNASTQTVIHWKQDGKIIASGPVLNLEFVGYRASGLYTCVAELLNVPGLTSSKDIEVIVQGSPEVFITSNEIEVKEGETVAMNCTAYGHPLPRITWHINSTEVTSQAVIYDSKNMVTSELTLLVSRDFINKSLTCTAFNHFNSSAAHILLLEKSMSTPFSDTSEEFATTWISDDDWGTPVPMATRAPAPESRNEKSYGILIVIVIICILLLAFLGAVLYFLYKKGRIPCGRSGKKDITNPGAKDKIIVEMKPDSPAEESVLLTGSQEKKTPDQEKYIDLRN